MKRLFLFIAVCMIGMVLPQSVFAADYNYTSDDGKLTISVVGNDVTITSNQAGALDGFMKTTEAANAISAITGAKGTIEFKGTFEGKDLDALQKPGNNNGYNCCVQSTVDMSDAQFVGPNGQPNYEGMKFKNWKDYVTEAISSNHAGDFVFRDDHPFKDCKKLTSITLGSGAFSSKLGNPSDFPQLATIVVKKDVVQLGSTNQWADGFFPNSSSLLTVTFEQGGTAPLVLGRNCFNGCSGINEVVIPSRTTLISTMAFGSTGLTDVTFEAPTTHVDPLVIKYQAFENCKSIKNVYVNVSPALKTLVCEYNAFDFEAMDGQTSPEHYDNMATLHFNEVDKEFYKGEWKEGFGFTQTELLAIRGEDNHSSDVISAIPIGIGSSSDLVNGVTPVEHSGSEYKGYSMGYLTNKPANGWQQFAKTGNEIPVLGDFLRSYSTATPYHMPTYGTSGTPIVKIYRIWKFEDGYEKGMDLLTETPQTKAYAREVKDYIPNYTGLIMVGITDKEVLYNFKLYNTGTVVQYPFTDQVQGDADNSNLLVPSNDQTLVINPTDKSGSEITYRNFGFKVYETGTRSATTRSTKTGKFLRAKIGTKITPNHSYLKLYKDFYHWKNEHGGVSNYDAEIYEEKVGNAKISFIYDLGEDEEEFGGIATVIRKAIEEADMEDGEFYTLQGVKVNKPTTKGVYIHNGKKVLVK